MPRLENPKRERFALFLSQGNSISSSYEKAGYPGDRRNASRLAQKPDIVGRVAELVAETQANNPNDLSDKTGADMLKILMKKGVSGGQLSASVSAAAVIAKADGSLDQLSEKSGVVNMTDAELANMVLPLFRDYDRQLRRKERPDGEILTAILRTMGNPEACGFGSASPLSPSGPPSEFEGDINA